MNLKLQVMEYSDLLFFNIGVPSGKSLSLMMKRIS